MRRNLKDGKMILASTLMRFENRRIHVIMNWLIKYQIFCVKCK